MPLDIIDGGAGWFGFSVSDRMTKVLLPVGGISEKISWNLGLGGQCLLGP